MNKSWFIFPSIKNVIVILWLTHTDDLRITLSSSELKKGGLHMVKSNFSDSYITPSNIYRGSFWILTGPKNCSLSFLLRLMIFSWHQLRDSLLISLPHIVQPYLYTASSGYTQLAPTPLYNKITFNLYTALAKFWYYIYMSKPLS